MNRVYILGSCRTPIGKLGGALSSMTATDLASTVIRESVSRANIKPADVEHVILGCVLQAGLGQNVARQASLKAGLPIETTAETVNCVCGSGLDAVNRAALLVKCGEYDIVIAGGTESMSNAPFAIRKGRFGYKIGYPQRESNIDDLMVVDGLWDAINDYHMGITAENVAEKYNLTREELDAFSLKSQQKAIDAIAEGQFNNEIVPVQIGKQLIEKDESPRAGLKIEDLHKLRPAFKEDGLLTAGNSSGINDGAATVVVISERKLQELGLKAEAEWIDGNMSGIDPAYMGLGPVSSSTKLLNKNNLTINDIDLIEGNEAFSSQAIAVMKELNIPGNKFNVNGGAIALGHPIGCSGCRILVTLIHAMKLKKAHYGLATLCVGGGMGCSSLIMNYEE